MTKKAGLHHNLMLYDATKHTQGNLLFNLGVATHNLSG